MPAYRASTALPLPEYVGAGFPPPLKLRRTRRSLGEGGQPTREAVVVTILSTRHIHPDAVTYFCDDARSYEAVEDSACGIRGNLE
jgi:hypothetical protein